MYGTTQFQTIHWLEINDWIWFCYSWYRLPSHSAWLLEHVTYIGWNLLCHSREPSFYFSFVFSQPLSLHLPQVYMVDATHGKGSHVVDMDSLHAIKTRDYCISSDLYFISIWYILAPFHTHFIWFGYYDLLSSIIIWYLFEWIKVYLIHVWVYQNCIKSKSK